jgi:hypothetical protein
MGNSVTNGSNPILKSENLSCIKSFCCIVFFIRTYIADLGSIKFVKVCGHIVFCRIMKILSATVADRLPFHRCKYYRQRFYYDTSHYLLHLRRHEMWIHTVQEWFFQTGCSKTSKAWLFVSTMFVDKDPYQRETLPI